MSIAVIGGSGLDQLPSFSGAESVCIDTPYGKHSGPILRSKLDDQTATFFYLAMEVSTNGLLI